MKINLRKAHELQLEIQRKVGNVRYAPDISIESQDQIESSFLEEKRENALEAVDTALKLLEIMYSIRGAIEDKKQISKISATLVEVAMVDRIISVYEGIIRDDPRPGKTILASRLEKTEATPYGRGAAVIHVSAYVEEDMEDFREKIEELKLRRRDLKDKLLGLNVEQKIELDEEAVKFLKSQRLL